MNQRIKVIIAAYTCNPDKGSEFAVGWGWVRAIAQHHDVWVIAETNRNQADVERALARDAELGRHLHFHFIESRTFPPCIEGIPIFYFHSYIQWQKRAYHLACSLHKQVRFDLAHQLTWVGFRAPGFLWKMDIPFVWGPIGGLEQTNWRLLPALGLRGFFHFACRNVINALQKRLLPNPKKAFQRAKGGVIAATEAIREQILKHYGVESEVICEVGLPDEQAASPSQRMPGEPLRLVWSGLHKPGKALPFFFHALARVPRSVDWRLDVLGKGPCTEKWERLAQDLRLADRCTWHGWLPRNEALAVMRSGHLFVITSVYDLTSTVLIEALANGLPVICPDHCGFRDVITPECGVKIACRTPRELVLGLTSEILRMARDEALRSNMAEGALRRSHDYSWEKKSRMINEVYARRLAEEVCQTNHRLQQTITERAENSF